MSQVISQVDQGMLPKLAIVLRKPTKEFQLAPEGSGDSGEANMRLKYCAYVLISLKNKKLYVGQTPLP